VCRSAQPRWAVGERHHLIPESGAVGLTGFLSKLPDNPVARIILNHAHAVGMDVSGGGVEKYDGVGRKTRVRLNFTEVGTGVRASVTMYDRGQSSASQIEPEELDWKRIFAQEGCRWLHTGGIFWHDGQLYAARWFKELEVEDRGGVGDGFSSGIAYGFLSGMKPQDIVDFGAAHGALLQTTRGDTPQVTLEEVLLVMKGGAARIQRCVCSPAFRRQRGS